MTFRTTSRLPKLSPRAEFWERLLAVLRLGSGMAGLAVYPFFTVLSPLLACVSNVLQALVTLRLVFCLSQRYEGREIADIKKLS